jgi:energy-coupling factor transporter ATP-binding protein EcfA2
MIKVQRLTYRYPNTADPALAGIDLKVHRGKFLLILGQNGAGKTTLAKQLNGLLLPDGGEVIVDGLSTYGGDIWEIRRRVGLLFQNPADQIVGNTLIEDISFGPENLNLLPEEIAHRVAKALELVGLMNEKARPSSGLSGGELQRLALAGILAMEPDYLVLDEPFVQIDAQAQIGLLRLLGELKRDGRGIVLISQDAELLEHADRVALLRDGRLLGGGHPQELFQDEKAFERADLRPPQLLQLYYALKEKFHFSSMPLSVEAFAEELRPQLGAISAITRYPKDGHLHPQRPGTGRTGAGKYLNNGHRRTHVLEVEDISFSYTQRTGTSNRVRPGEVEALRGISLEIEKGSFNGITGPSSSGKSTLVQLLAGLLRPDSGTVRLRSREVKGPTARVGLVFQNPRSQLFAENLHRELTYGLREMGLPRAERERRAREACAAVGLDYDRDRSPFALSGGEQVRLCIATALALEPEVLILDETLTVIDPPSRAELIGHLLKLNREGMTIIVVSHRLGELLERCDRMFILDRGRLVASGRPLELLDREELELPPVTRLLLRLGLPPAFTVEGSLRILHPLLDRSIL